MILIQFFCIDKKTGVPVNMGVSLGWLISNGPDGQPIELSRVADTFEFHRSKLSLKGLATTDEGGLRGQCIASPSASLVSLSKRKDAKDSVVPIIMSPVFAIHIKQRGEEEPKKDPKVPSIWFPGAGRIMIYFAYLNLSDVTSSRLSRCKSL